MDVNLAIGAALAYTIVSAVVFGLLCMYNDHARRRSKSMALSAGDLAKFSLLWPYYLARYFFS